MVAASSVPRNMWRGVPVNTGWGFHWLIGRDLVARLPFMVLPAG